MNKDDLGIILRDIALQHGSFLTRSGTIVEQYFDKYLFESQPLILTTVAEHLLTLSKTENCSFAGLEMGGIPIATAMSLASLRPLLFVRKSAKQYGTENVIEGGKVDNVPVVIVEDVVTQGGAVIHAIQHIRARGGIVSQVLCVLDRQAGGKSAIEALEVDFQALFLKSELF